MVVIHRQTLGFWLEIGRRRGVLTMIDAGMNHLYPIIKENNVWLCAEMVVLSCLIPTLWILYDMFNQLLPSGKLTI